ncbi:MGMT family protein [Athelia psychrophila]|uniref:MGMT family protein n=1 Tax=Athelia psychrophila TaxID=1759441 RepID=A0A166CGK4_9AGAM|nr:MGMT family protein [Fibularhizoctonia sp. CBS 109695]
MDSAEFHAAVYHVVRQIPPLKVTSYGHVAALIGMPKHSRHVGQALKFLSPDATPPVPWYRVVSSSGAISSRGPGTEGAQRQKDELEAEGVEVSTGRTGDMRVNLAVWGWFPQVGSIDLPEFAGDAAEGDEELDQ